MGANGMKNETHIGGLQYMSISKGDSKRYTVIQFSGKRLYFKQQHVK